MRLRTIVHRGSICPAVEDEGRLVALEALAGHDLRAVVGADEAQWAKWLAQGRPVSPDTPLCPPVRPSKIVAIGLNYRDHIRETGLDAPKVPLIFAKFPSSLIAAGEAIAIDAAVTSRVDWEAELAVVIGRRAQRVTAARALEHVFGYTVANDVSARDVQFSDGQWTRGKSLDTFCPLGPDVVTADEVPDPQGLPLRTRVNGEVVQESSTGEMVFGVAELISFCSHSFTLEPGDVLLTGTAWGCGEFMDPPRHLAPGDVVEVEVGGIGVLRNPVVAVDGALASLSERSHPSAS